MLNFIGSEEPVEVTTATKIDSEQLQERELQLGICMIRAFFRTGALSLDLILGLASLYLACAELGRVEPTESQKDCGRQILPFGRFCEALLGLTTDGSGFPYVGRNDFEWK